jgi:hypothetical protein
VSRRAAEESVRASSLDWGVASRTAIVDLLPPLSTYVDGATLVADGGWIAQ